MFLIKINSFFIKENSLNKRIFISFFFVFCSIKANAHVPPISGATDCGTIQGGVFYSEYYDPPSGTPVSNGACSWEKQGTQSCGTYRYNGVNYTLYNYKFICNAPLDSPVYAVSIGFLLFAVFRKRKFLTLAS